MAAGRGGRRQRAGRERARRRRPAKRGGGEEGGPRRRRRQEGPRGQEGARREEGRRARQEGAPAGVKTTAEQPSTAPPRPRAAHHRAPGGRAGPDRRAGRPAPAPRRRRPSPAPDRGRQPVPARRRRARGPATPGSPAGEVSEDDLRAVVEGWSHDPHGVLGAHLAGDGWVVRTLRPDAVSVAVARRGRHPLRGPPAARRRHLRGAAPRSSPATTASRSPTATARAARHATPSTTPTAGCPRSASSTST